ncbi:MAG TPA: hypothetical protein VNU26_02260 [Mycobacteriales bacterium]|nr:hypothetical protein [Mycobacteriales bacterium]
MVDLLLAVIAVAVIVTFACAALMGVTVAPFVVALGFAERRGASPARVGVAALAGSAVALSLALLAWRADAVPPAAALPLLLSWVVPLVVAYAPRGARFLGQAGRHERLRT